MRLMRYMLDEVKSRVGGFSCKYLAQTLFTIGYWVLALVIFGEVYDYLDYLDKTDAAPGGVLAAALVLVIATTFVLYAFLLECLNNAKKRIAEENAELLDNIRNPR